MSFAMKSLLFSLLLAESAWGLCTTPQCILAAGDLLGSMNQTVDPCEDFYEFACGGWMAANGPIPETSSKISRIGVLAGNVDDDIRSLFDAGVNADDPVSVANAFTEYDACLDIDTIEARGYQDYLALVYSDERGGMPMIQSAYDASSFTVEEVVADNQVGSITITLMGASPSLDNFNTSTNVIWLDQPVLVLPRDVYLDEDGNYDDIVAAYLTYMGDLAKLMVSAAAEEAPVDDATVEASVQAVYDFEVALANITVPDEDRRDITELYNERSVFELIERYPLIDWSLYFNTLFAGVGIAIEDDERIIVTELDFFNDLQNLLIATDAVVVADYLYMRRLIQVASEGPAEMRDIQFAFDSVLNGQTEETPRDQYCTGIVTSRAKGYDFAIGKIYVDNFFDEETKNQAEALVSAVRTAFEGIVESVDWMDDATKENATEKQQLITQKVAYPDWAQDPTQLDAFYADSRTPEADTHLLNVLGMLQFSLRRVLLELREVPDKDIWGFAPIVVNAQYNPNENSITIPAAFLRIPFFGRDYPRYMNYAAIGQVIGHEITHGFDDSGRLYDGSGNIEEWWTQESSDAYDDKAQCYIDQYDAYTYPEISDEAHIDGETTQGENIADNGGIHAAYLAWVESLTSIGPEDTLPGLDSYTPEQLFFVSFGHILCELSTDAYLENQLLTDPHSPGRYRVIGPMQNSPDFANAFQCQEGSYMNPADKCDLW